jgi:putative FmdB family regulatory protein
MPCYEYACAKCGMIEERIRPFSESDMGSICPNCGVVTDKIVSSCSFEIPGFKHGERINPDEIAERCMARSRGEGD